jgi:hypothetical protein
MQNLRKKSLEEMARTYLSQSIQLGYSQIEAKEMLQKLIDGGQTASIVEKPEKDEM